jgi:predicted small metal-binding protein
MLPNYQPAGELLSIVEEVVPTHIPSAHRISSVREDRESHIDFRLKLGIP